MAITGIGPTSASPCTYIFHLSYNKIKCLPSSLLFFCNEPIWLANLTGPSLKIKETMEALQNRRFYLEVRSSPPLAQLYRWKKDNICQSIWDKSEVLFGTFWETCENLGTLCLGTTPAHTHKERKGRSLHSMRFSLVAWKLYS